MALTVHKIEDVFTLADFISDGLGEFAEVVVHDARDFESSIVYIRNGHLSGRKVGDGATDAALKLIKEGDTTTCGYVVGVAAKSAQGRRFRSSTLFIHDEHGRLIGLLCVNIDVTIVETLVGMLSKFIPDYASGSPGEDHRDLEETLQGDPAETTRRMVRSVLSKYPLPPSSFSSAQKHEAILSMYSEGVFLMKGAVSIVAEECGMSVATVYRYLEKARSENE
ncbi:MULTISPECIES: helix-turn-helix transcriptional regulator [Enorma]|uniref:Transcriptional regulator n=1 Tax=[Collinsella] massiliensis TaxID=1232426 RepID=A0A1Y3XYX8_9ACTN|nr:MULTISPECIES: PAS domain-containing protein [Enorma]OUN87220.1 hypothetical protein B5G02_07685 [[Collinsella] massiliensis]